MHKVTKSSETEEWQSAGILVHDAWIEFTNRSCSMAKIDISDIDEDKVVPKLRKMGIEEKSFNLARAAFNLSFKTYHDRKIEKHIAMACIVTSTMSMQTLIEHTAGLQQKLER